MALSLPVLEPFDVQGEGCGIRWPKWLARFKISLTAAKITDTEQKMAILLHCAGGPLQEIFSALPGSNTATTYEETVDILTAYFIPKKNIDYEVFKFRKAMQLQGETTDTYHVRLRELAQTCEFHDVDREIKTQIMHCGNSEALRMKALREQDLTLDKLLKMARIMEMSETQSKIMTVNYKQGNSDANVNAIRAKSFKGPKMQNQGQRQNFNYSGKFNTNTSSFTVKQNTGICRNCGYEYPHQGGQVACPARNQACNFCSKIGHFSKCCRSKAEGKPKYNNNFPCQPNNGYNQRKKGNNFSGKPKQVQFLNNVNPINQYKSDTNGDEFLFTVGTKSETTGEHPILEVWVAEKPMKVILDTGATVNMMDETVFETIAKRVTLIPTNTRIFAYGAKHPLPLIGTFETQLKCKTNSKIINTIFHVAANQGQARMLTLIGYKTMKELDISGEIFFVNTAIRNEWDEKYSDLFEGMGKLPNHKVKLHIDQNVPPVVQPHRRVPFHLRKALEEELNRLLSDDIIEPVTGPTPWVSPVVIIPKKGDSEQIRLCVDMREANRAIIRERHVMPTVEDIIQDLNGSKFFTKLDLQKGYHQLELEKECRYITVFSTHKGLFQYKRLNFGISSAAEVFQNRISNVIQGIQQAKNVSDDILVHGVNEESHDKCLKEVLQRLRENNLKLNKNKCSFNQKKLVFYGLEFSENGMSIDPSKIQAIKEMEAPNNPDEVRSLLGLATYCSRFIPNFSDITLPLRNLTKRNSEWIWSNQQQIAMDTLKQNMTAETTLAYFNPNKYTTIYVDASPTGLGAILTQEHSKGIPAILAYASKTLSPVETRYSQTEREALAVVFGCEHFHIYISGAQFTVVTDHKPLITLLGNPKAKTSARMERWNLRLQPYEMKIMYKPGKDNPADYLSRHAIVANNENNTKSKTEEFVNMIVKNAIPKTLTWTEIQETTKKDVTLNQVIDCLNRGTWHKYQSISNVDLEIFRAIEKVKEEISVVDGVLLKNHKIVIPLELQERVLQIAHEGHMGLVKTKQLLRSKVWFFKMDQQVESLIRSCIPCLASTPESKMEPLKMTTLPEGIWESVAIDFCGPFPTGEYILVLMDEYSRYPVAEILTNISAQTTILALNKIFAIFGLPITLKSDNGPPFQSAEFKNFMVQMGIKHRRVTPLWPQANGTAERFMQPLMKAIRTANMQGQNWKQTVQAFLLNYRNTSHCTTKCAPATLMFGRELRTKLPMAPHTMKRKGNEENVKDIDAKAKEKMKEYADKRRQSKPSNLKMGDKVLVKTKKTNKLSTPYNPRPYTVSKIKGSMITAENQNHEVTRNSSYFKPIGSTPQMEPQNNNQCNLPETTQPVIRTPNTPETYEPQITSEMNNSPRSTQIPTTLETPSNTTRSYGLRGHVKRPRRLVEEC